MDPISQEAQQKLKDLLANVPSTGKGAANLAVTNDGFKVGVAYKPHSKFTSSAYWQKIRNGSATWGAQATFTW